jgi:hypothetical protein
MVRSLIDRREYPTLQECVYLNQASLGLIADPPVEVSTLALLTFLASGRVDDVT